MKLKNIKHVVWDWNGTLLDDTWLCRDVMNEMLARRGLPVMSHARYQEVFDFPVIRYYERLGFDFTRESFEVLGAEFIAGYERRRLEPTLNADAMPAMLRLQAAGITQSILSGYHHRTLEELLAHHGVRQLFHDVVGSDDIYARGKADQGRQWLAKQGWSSETVVVVGDTVHDFEVSQAMKAHGALVTTGSHSRKRLEQCCSSVFDSLAEFAAAI